MSPTSYLTAPPRVEWISKASLPHPERLPRATVATQGRGAASVPTESARPIKKPPCITVVLVHRSGAHSASATT